MNISEQLYPSYIRDYENVNYIKHDGSVAVIMRTKDRPILLARALKSVLEQEYQNWHLYLINDGGNKKSVEDLVNIYASSFDGRLTLLHNEKSLGMEAASNKGFELASEEFIVVHDDDDSWTPQFLQKTTNFLKENKHAVAVITNCVVIHEEITNNYVQETARYEWGYWRDDVDISILLKGNITPPICLLIRMDVAKSIGPFNADLPVLGDWDYNLRLFRCGEILTLDEKLAFYHHRVNATSIYGNSVHAGVNKHKLYAIRYKNALVRKSFQESQGNYGLLQILLLEQDKNLNEIRKLANQLGNSIEHLNQQLMLSNQEVKKILNERVTIYNRIRLLIRKIRRWKKQKS
ncbi:MAG: glycosyltransferase family 2 protein [Gilliamella sp.]|uniref:glycosyltransferase family 2 protein n=1 Tax=Gilliamella sp. TaxID=1891236 RepID=UPI0025D190A1|nr:glycosyltransferase family 2 protein [Gilliamella sp.]MCO6544984.1 glycosyltransferase family 2 protein [Gilliamella sp.]MCO6547472.1 glycosyltransferase family 2 protein [Gilliamella sp.]